MIPPDTLPDRASSDDRALVQRIADGDPQAFSTLYDRHSQMVYSHALHLLGDVAEGEDAVEETFWRVWRRAADYDPAVPDVETWLLMICRQRATERLRVKKRSHDRLLEDTTGLASGEPGGSTSRETGGTAASLASIPADQRTVLELAFFRGMAPADVATVTKQSPETARTRLRVAMRKLRDALAEPGETAAPPAPVTEVEP
ncbi:MAG TPA: sigma-70 family RNA polymerase sigma factor [Gemmatimonadaceae bacterium]|nr:sigma-70 family RNA polymerase sigma factor [Gemmatimonadaceae bacterium]